MSSRGIVLFGVNNSSIDYIRLAIIASAFIRRNMDETNICLITNEGSKTYHDSTGKWLLTKYFDDVILLPNEYDNIRESNTRVYRDTLYYSVSDRFNNESRASVYDLSPYDETIVVDIDYLICNNNLSACWGSKEDIMINKSAISLMHAPLEGAEFRLNPFGIKMYWATAIYFKKSEKAKELFSLVDHIRENWDFYKLTYEFPNALFRNDYAFSIAIHILNGFVESSETVVSLPEPSIITALDKDQFLDVVSPNTIRLFVNDLTDTWKFYLTKLKGHNVHCMNKISLLTNMESIMGVLE